MWLPTFKAATSCSRPAVRINKPLTSQIETVLSKTFAYRSRVVVRSFEQMKAIVEAAPIGFGARPTAYRYDVIFLKHPLTADEALKSMTAKPGVDRVFAGNGVLYFSRLISKAAQSHLESQSSVRRPIRT